MFLSVKKRIIIYTVGIIAVVVLIMQCSGCSGIRKVTDVITNPSAREVYKREFKDNETVFNVWQAAHDKALYDSLTVNLPYGEKGKFGNGHNKVYSYTITLEEGEMLRAEVYKDSVTQRVFTELYENDEMVANAAIDENGIAYATKTSGVYQLIIQPEVAANTNFFISITKHPQYSFPVAGKSNNAVGSFWGMPRDGGKRRHEGIDIFAAKGTPVTAATNGYISYAGEKGLGGKQVWLRDGLLGKSLYYAHLDSIAVNVTARVSAGDTLGFVGNTGNARFTPPHLHFGIYRSGGAVNPLPFVYETETINRSDFPFTLQSQELRVKSTANIRQGPSTEFEKLGQLDANDTVIVLGQHKDWLHIETPAGSKAFLHKSLARELK